MSTRFAVHLLPDCVISFCWMFCAYEEIREMLMETKIVNTYIFYLHKTQCFFYYVHFAKNIFMRSSFVCMGNLQLSCFAVQCKICNITGGSILCICVFLQIKMCNNIFNLHYFVSLFACFLTAVCSVR